MTDLALRVEHLSKRYRIGKSRGLFERLNVSTFQRSNVETLWALKDVSFEVKRGEVVGIIGRNGAGKSTLLKILSRITEPTSGRAILNGRVGSLLDASRGPGSRSDPELTGRENIYLNGAIHGMKKREIDRKLDEIVAFAAPTATAAPALTPIPTPDLAGIPASGSNGNIWLQIGGVLVGMIVVVAVAVRGLRGGRK